MKYPEFYKYLLSLTPSDAAFHYRECLFAGGEMARHLYCEIHEHEWNITKQANIAETIEKLHKKYGEIK